MNEALKFFHLHISYSTPALVAMHQYIPAAFTMIPMMKHGHVHGMEGVIFGYLSHELYPLFLYCGVFSKLVMHMGHVQRTPAAVISKHNLTLDSIHEQKDVRK